MRASLALSLLASISLPAVAQAELISQAEVRRLLAPKLDVCMKIPIGPYRIGAADMALDAQITGLRDRGLVTLTEIGQGDSLLSGDSDLERLEEQRPFSKLVDVALADGIDRSALCTLSHHRLGVPLTQTIDSLKIEPVETGEAKVLVEGKLDRVLSKYASRFDPALTTMATFQAVLAYDIATKAWVVRRFVTQNARASRP